MARQQVTYQASFEFVTQSEQEQFFLHFLFVTSVVIPQTDSNYSCWATSNLVPRGYVERGLLHFTWLLAMFRNAGDSDSVSEWLPSPKPFALVRQLCKYNNLNMNVKHTNSRDTAYVWYRYLKSIKFENAPAAGRPRIRRHTLCLQWRPATLICCLLHSNKILINTYNLINHITIYKY